MVDQHLSQISSLVKNAQNNLHTKLMLYGEVVNHMQGWI